MARIVNSGAQPRGGRRNRGLPCVEIRRYAPAARIGAQDRSPTGSRAIAVARKPVSGALCRRPRGAGRQRLGRLPPRAAGLRKGSTGLPRGGRPPGPVGEPGVGDPGGPEGCGAGELLPAAARQPAHAGMTTRPRLGPGASERAGGLPRSSGCRPAGAGGRPPGTGGPCAAAGEHPAGVREGRPDDRNTRRRILRIAPLRPEVAWRAVPPGPGG